MSFDFSEFDNFVKEFDKGVKDLTSKDEIPLSELFGSQFMRKHTDFSSIEDFFKQSGYDDGSEELDVEIPDEVIDQYVQEHTSFDSWQEMLDEATGDYLAKKLGF